MMLPADTFTNPAKFIQALIAGLPSFKCNPDELKVIHDAILAAYQSGERDMLKRCRQAIDQFGFSSYDILSNIRPS